MRMLLIIQHNGDGFGLGFGVSLNSQERDA